LIVIRISSKERGLEEKMLLRYSVLMKEEMKKKDCSECDGEK